MGTHADAVRFATGSCQWTVRTLTRYFFRAGLLIVLLAGVFAAALADTVNYAYVRNDPLNKTDSTGMAEDPKDVKQSCTGSRVGAGCDFVQGSEQRTSLLAGNHRAEAPNAENAPPRSNAEAPSPDQSKTPKQILEELEKLAKEKLKEKVKEEAKEKLKEAARKAGVTEGQICAAEHCAAAGARMSVCLLEHCEYEIQNGEPRPKAKERD